MTPIDKAKELVSKYWDDIPDLFFEEAKQCALIAVDEILNNVMRWWETPIKDEYFITQKMYWVQVKNEIEKL
jgi:hypothetical protein